MKLSGAIFSILMAVFIVSSVFPLINEHGVSGDLSSPGSLSTRNNIYIDSDSKFTSANGVKSGSGTKSSPYIIRDWSIESKSMPAIYIYNTRAYFVIRNCYLHHSSTTYGIYFSNVQNATVENCRVILNRGIYIRWSKNITFDDNAIYNCDNGFNVYYSNKVLINNNKINNTEKAIYVNDIRKTSNNVITNNELFNNDMGVFIQMSYGNIVQSNHIHNNSNTGLLLYSTKNNVLYNNKMNDNRFNFGITGGPEYFNHTITANNTVDGMKIYVYIGQSDLELPPDTGYVALINCNNITGRNLNLSNNYQGLYLYNASNCTFTNCTISGNRDGFWNEHSDNNTFTNNIIMDNLYYGFNIYYSSGTRMLNNYISNCTDGIQFAYSTYNYAFNNTIADQLGSGIKSTWSSVNTISKNNIFDCYRGIYLSYTDREIFYNNTIGNSSYYNLYVENVLGDNSVHTFPPNNTIDGKRTYFIYKKSNLTIPEDAGLVWIYDSINITLKRTALDVNTIFGIRIFNSSRCYIENNSISGSYFGIIIKYSDNITVDNNNITSIYGPGIAVYYSPVMVITNNSMPLQSAMELYYSDFSRICNNKIINHTSVIGTKIYVYISRELSITGNEIKSSSYGISLYKADDIELAFNSIYDLISYGLVIQESNNYRVYNNTISGNDIGINCQNSINITIFNNTINRSDIYSIYLYRNTNNSVINNTIFSPILYNTQRGILSKETSGLKIMGNDIFNFSDEGILIEWEGDFSISDNKIFNCGKDGIKIQQSSNNKITNNTVFNNGANGLELINTDTNTIVNNTIIDNSNHGIFLENSDYNRVFNNNISNNSGIGSHFSYSKYNSIKNNTVISNKKDGLNLSYSGDNQINGNEIIKNTEVGIYISVSPSNDIIDNIITGNGKEGLYLYASSNNKINYNNFSDNTRTGLKLINSGSNTIDNNEIKRNGGEGLYLEFSSSNSLNNNNISKNKNSGIFFWGTGSNTIINNTLFQNGYIALRCIGSSNNDIRDNIITSHEYGLIFINGGLNSILNNQISDNTRDGIYISSAQANDIWQNTIFDNLQAGLNISGSENNTIYYNTVFNNSKHGLRIDITDDNYVINNSFQKNDIGIELNVSSRNFVFNNTVSTNSLGIYLDRSNKNFIMNNYFNNTINYHMTNSTGTYWNGFRTPGTNIIGGPYRGGNYWSNYTGNDTDGDRLGNTDLPFGPGDSNPLVYKLEDITPPGIWDRTTGNPVTGQQFTVKADAWDIYQVDTVYLEYWFDTGTHTNVSMTIISGDDKDGTYEIKIDIPDTALELNYYLSAVDAFDNWYSRKPSSAGVQDAIKPEIIDHTAGTPCTGKNYLINVSVSDNRDTTFSVTVDYRFDYGLPSTKTLTKTGNYYQAEIFISSSAKIISYTLFARDKSSNLGTLDGPALDIKDILSPYIEDLTDESPGPGAEYQMNFLIIENINILEAKMEYWFDDGGHTTIMLTPTWTCKVSVPKSALYFNANVTAIDDSDNAGYLDIHKKVVDNSAPVIEDRSSDEVVTGTTYTIKLSITDESLLKVVTVEYWFDSGAHATETVSPNGDIYELPVDVPEDAERITYRTFAQDIHNNNATKQKLRPVIDNIKPVLLDETTGLPTTGDEFQIEASVTDNIGPVSMELEYWFDSGGHLSAKFSGYTTIKAPGSALILNYKIVATDRNQNRAEVTNTLNVMDNDPPEIEDNNPSDATSGMFTFNVKISDNRELKTSYLEYWFDSGDDSKIKISFSGTETIEIPDTAQILHYMIQSEDKSGNEEKLNNEISVRDKKIPSAEDKSQKIGNGFRFIIYASDNIGISGVKVKFRFDQSGYKELTLKSTGENYTGDLSIPGGAEFLYYTVTAFDASGNKIELSEQTVEVRVPGGADDVEKPDENDTAKPDENVSKPDDKSGISGYALALIIVVVAIVAILAFYMFMKRRKGAEFEPEPQPAALDQQPPQPALCPTCGQPVTAQEGTGYKFCSNCNKYVILNK